MSTKLKQNVDVQFWSMASGDCCQSLEEIVKLYTAIRGFSYAKYVGGKYKTANVKMLEKSNGL